MSSAAPSRCTVDSDDCVSTSEGDAEIVSPAMTPELMSSIVKQVEFYFSDANLATDKKLLKHIKKNANGYVPVKLFTNFRKVRALTKDAADIAAALSCSTALQLSDDGKQVCRLAPVPEFDVDDIQRRTIVVENLPATPTIESVTELFSAYGKVNLVRICSKETKGKLPHWLTATTHTLQHQQHALVEFCDTDSAVLAVAALHEADGWGSAVKVRHLLVAPSDKDGHIAPMPVRGVHGASTPPHTSRGPRFVERGCRLRSDPLRSEGGAPIASLPLPGAPPPPPTSTACDNAAATRQLGKSQSDRSRTLSVQPLDIELLRNGAALPVSGRDWLYMVNSTPLQGASGESGGGLMSPVTEACSPALTSLWARDAIKEQILSDVDGFLDRFIAASAIAGLAFEDLASEVGSGRVTPTLGAASLLPSAALTAAMVALVGADTGAVDQYPADVSPFEKHLPFDNAQFSEESPRAPSRLRRDGGGASAAAPGGGGFYSDRGIETPPEAACPSRWQSYDEDLTTLLQNKGRRRSHVDSSPSPLPESTLTPAAPGCPPTLCRLHRSEGGATLPVGRLLEFCVRQADSWRAGPAVRDGRGGGHSSAGLRRGDRTPQALAADARRMSAESPWKPVCHAVVRQPGGGGRGGGGNGRKDYASWAAATPEFRAAAEVAGAARSGGRQQGHRHHQLSSGSTSPWGHLSTCARGSCGSGASEGATAVAFDGVVHVVRKADGGRGW